MAKKLLLITNEFPTKVATFISRDIKILIEDGYIIELYAFYPLNSEYWIFVPDYIKHFIKDNKLIIKHLTIQNYIQTIFSLKSYKNRDFFIEVFSILKASMKFGFKPFQKTLYILFWTFVFQNILNKEYEKVISYWGNYASTVGYLYSRYTKQTPFITYIHAGVDLYREQIYLLEKLKYASKIITVCQFNVDFVQKLYPNDFKELKDKLYVYHLPIEIKDTIPVDKKQDQIIAVGRLDKKKGLNFLIEACGLLARSNINFQLVIVGDGPERDALDELCKIENIRDKVTFTGHLPYEKVERLIAQSTILAHCSPELGDAVPTVIKESLSLGTPVVGSNIVGIPELLDFGGCGILFEPASSESLYTALKELLSDTELQKKLSSQGKIFANEMFNINNNKDILLNIINDEEK